MKAGNHSHVLQTVSTDYAPGARAAAGVGSGHSATTKTRRAWPGRAMTAAATSTKSSQSKYHTPATRRVRLGARYAGRAGVRVIVGKGCDVASRRVEEGSQQGTRHCTAHHVVFVLGGPSHAFPSCAHAFAPRTRGTRGPAFEFTPASRMRPAGHRKTPRSPQARTARAHGAPDVLFGEQRHGAVPARCACMQL